MVHGDAVPGTDVTRNRPSRCTQLVHQFSSHAPVPSARSSCPGSEVLAVGRAWIRPHVSSVEIDGLRHEVVQQLSDERVRLRRVCWQRAWRHPGRAWRLISIVLTVALLRDIWVVIVFSRNKSTEIIRVACSAERKSARATFCA